MRVFLRNTLVIMGSSLCILSAFAQATPTILKTQDQTVMDEQGAWVYLPLGEDAVVIQPSDRPRQWIPLATEGKNFGYRSFRNRYIWDIRRINTVSEGKSTPHAYLYRHSIESPKAVWEQDAEIDTNAGIPHYLVPLDRSDWFLAIGPYTGFYKEGRASHVALFRRQNDKIIFDDLVDMPYAERPHIGEVEPVARPRSANPESAVSSDNSRTSRKTIIRPISLTPDLWLPTLLPDHLVLGATKAGVLWIFGLTNGLCQRTVDLGGVDTQELDKIGLLDHFLLGVQPSRDHQLIVVTRPPEALIFARALYTPADTTKRLRSGSLNQFMEIMANHTGLQWWSVDPKTGKKEIINNSSPYPEYTASYTQANQFRFLVGPNGDIHASHAGSWKDSLGVLGLNEPRGTRSPETGKSAVDESGKNKEVKSDLSKKPTKGDIK